MKQGIIFLSGGCFTRCRRHRQKGRPHSGGLVGLIRLVRMKRNFEARSELINQSE